MKLKTNFWYESNACWGWVETIYDLIGMCRLQIDPHSGGLDNVDDFLDKSKQIKGGRLNFGTRKEHRGTKTLREYLKESGDLDNFLTKINEVVRCKNTNV